MTDATTHNWRRRFGRTEGLPEAAFPGEGSAAERIDKAEGALLRWGCGHAADEAREIAQLMREAAAVLGADEDRSLTPLQAASLEVVCALDGSRPTFPVREGRVDLEGAPAAGGWRALLEDLAEPLAAVVACTGRIDRAGAHVGTGWLAAPTLAVTNRHVLDALGPPPWRDVSLDFGGEAGRPSHDRRALLDVVFSPAGQASGMEGGLDLALLRLSPSALAGDAAARALGVGGFAADDLGFMPQIAVVGFPAGAASGFIPPALFERHRAALAALLGPAGLKRVSPGCCAPPEAEDGGAGWTLMHDATTLNGNSGSPLLMLGAGFAPSDGVAAGLHFGGDWSEGRRLNRAHCLSATLDGRSAAGATLGEVLAREGVRLAG